MELIVRALIIKNRKILVCWTHGRDYYFLPGGHVEFGETMQVALRRELAEELGVDVAKAKFIGAVENLFVQNQTQKHEVSFVFHVDINESNVVSKEEHISFLWMGMDEFINNNIAPQAMKDAIIKWTAEKNAFFIEEKSSNPF